MAYLFLIFFSLTFRISVNEIFELFSHEIVSFQLIQINENGQNLTK